MDPKECFRNWLEYTHQQVIDDDHPLQVDAVGGQDNLVFDVYCHPEAINLTIGAPCRQGAAPHSTSHVAAVLADAKPCAAAVAGGLDADKSATAGEGVGHASPRP